MDCNSSSDLSQFSGFSASEISWEHKDPHNGLIYNAVEACLGETITFTFHSKKVFDEVIRRLSNLYLFTPNQDQSGQSTTTTLGNEKIVITAYKSSKLLVQGKESRIWRGTVLSPIIEVLLKEEETTKPKRAVSMPIFIAQKPVKAKSTSILGSISKTIFGPSLNKDVIKLGKELQKAEKAAKKGKQEATGILLNRRYSTPRRGANMQTVPKTVYSGSEDSHSEASYTCDVTDQAVATNLALDPMQGKEPTTNGKGQQQFSSTEENTTQCIQLDILQKEITSLSDQRNNLQAKCNTQSCQIKSYQKTISKMTTETKKNASLIQSLVQKLEVSERKMADLNAKVLITEEENKKLKTNSSSLTSENKKLQATLNKKSTYAENNEDTLRAVSNLADEVGSLKTSIQQIQNKVDKSASEADFAILKAEMKAMLRQELSSKSNQDEQAPINVDTYVTNKSVSNDTLQNSKNPSEKITKANSRKKSVYIIGDSVTKSLNPKRLSGDKYTVTIKTNPGALIKDINDKIKSLSQEDSRLSTCDAIIIHAGINNISEAHSAEDIIEQYDDLVSHLKQINNSAKIIVSSVLPKKNDKLSAQYVREINSKLQQKCGEEAQMHFMNNTPKFILDSSVNKTLYTDEVHLSAKGAAVLAKNIMATISQCLHTGYNSGSKQAGNFHRASLQKTMGQHHHPRGPRGPRGQRGPTRQGSPRIPPWLMAQYWGPPSHYY